jgi:RNA polymerase sigma factor (sigma-70 family)
MSISDDFRDLVSRAESGSQGAIWELVEALSPHVHRLVSKKMGPTIRQRVGVSDIIQATWASLLLGDQPLSGFEDEDALRAYVCSIAMNKLRMAVRANLGAQARDARRETSSTHRITNLTAAVEPSPSEVFVFRESWDAFMDSQPEHYRQIVTLRLEGLTYPMIAERLRLNERTVRRVLQKLVVSVGA